MRVDRLYKRARKNVEAFYNPGVAQAVEWLTDQVADQIDRVSYEGEEYLDVKLYHPHFVAVKKMLVSHGYPFSKFHSFKRNEKVWQQKVLRGVQKKLRKSFYTHLFACKRPHDNQSFKGMTISWEE